MRPEKIAMSAELKTKVSGSGFMILANYKGLSVGKTTDLRKRLRGANAKVQVVKNRVVKHVLKDAGAPSMDAGLKGPSALIYGNGDVVAAAKILKTFIKENEKPVIKIGALQGSVLTAADVEALAALPSREVLLGQVVGTIAAPMSQLVGVLSQKVASVLYVVQAVADKKGKAS